MTFLIYTSDSCTVKESITNYSLRQRLLNDFDTTEFELNYFTYMVIRLRSLKELIELRKVCNNELIIDLFESESKDPKHYGAPICESSDYLNEKQIKAFDSITGTIEIYNDFRE